MIKEIMEAYARAVHAGVYNLEFANADNNMAFHDQVLAAQMPEREFGVLNREHQGCCLHFSMYLLYLLQELGVRAYFTTTPETDGGNHCSVLYFDETGQKYIADPVMDVKEGTMKRYALDYDTFAKEAGTIRHYDLLGDAKDTQFFTEFLQNGEIKV